MQSSSPVFAFACCIGAFSSKSEPFSFESKGRFRGARTRSRYANTLRFTSCCGHCSSSLRAVEHVHCSLDAGEQIVIWKVTAIALIRSKPSLTLEPQPRHVCSVAVEHQRYNSSLFHPRQFETRYMYSALLHARSCSYSFLSPSEAWTDGSVGNPILNANNLSSTRAAVKWDEGWFSGAICGGDGMKHSAEFRSFKAAWRIEPHILIQCDDEFRMCYRLERDNAISDEDGHVLQVRILDIGTVGGAGYLIWLKGRIEPQKGISPSWDRGLLVHCRTSSVPASPIRNCCESLLWLERDNQICYGLEKARSRLANAPTTPNTPATGHL